MSKQPNILLIFTDQQRFDAMGAYGNPVIHTPNMDRLAREGALFRNAVSPCPLCMPARTAAITGYTASRLGILTNGLPTNPGIIKDTLATALRGAGYATKAIGKMHFSNKPYEVCYGMEDMELSEEMRGCRFAKTPQDVVFDAYDEYLMQRGVWGWEKPPEIGYNEIKPVDNGMPKEHHVTQWCGDRTVEYLKNGKPKDGKPFFLWSSFVKPHVPYDCPLHLRGFYDWRNMPAAAAAPDDDVCKNPHVQELKIKHEFDLYSEKANRIALANYYANITFIDEQVGRILDTLKEEGLEEDTVVLFTADHGDLMGDHGLWYKSIGYEGSMHIPMLLKAPGKIAPGTRADGIVSLMDIYPTLCAFAGAAYTDADNRPGRDLMDILGGAESDFAASEMYASPNYMLHARCRNYKYLFYQNGGIEELYDLSRDPHEFHNLIAEPALAETAREIRRRCCEWIRQYGDPATALDANGNLRAEPLRYSLAPPSPTDNPKPFSRMPWESRAPQNTLPDGKRGWYWDVMGGDYSAILKNAMDMWRAKQ